MTQINKKILFLIYDLERGGPELRLLDLAREFPETIEMHICVTSERTSLRKEFENCGVSVRILPCKKPWLELKTIFQMNRYIKKLQPDCINVFDLKELLLLAPNLLLPERIRPWKLYYHSVNSLLDATPRQKVFLKTLLTRCPAGISNSNFSKLELVRDGFMESEKMHVIYNGIDSKKFRMNRERRNHFRRVYGFEEDTFVIGTVGNFRPQKNYSFLLNAFSKFLKSFPNARLLCVGGGPLLDETKILASKMGVERHIIFTGYLDDVVGHMSAMDVFVLCSKWEGLPNAVIQAMSCGLAVIVSDVGACREIVDHGKQGLVFPVDDEKTFLDCLESIAKNRKTSVAMGAAGKEKATRFFSLERMVAEYAKLFLEPQADNTRKSL